jgi:hypothetical protein
MVGALKINVQRAVVGLLIIKAEQHHDTLSSIPLNLVGAFEMTWCY